MTRDDVPLPRQLNGGQEVLTIPVSRIRVANPRVRNRKVFAGIVESIAAPSPRPRPTTRVRATT